MEMTPSREYDLAFSIGAACLCSGALRACTLQYLSFPLDWVIGLSLQERTRLVVDGPGDFIKKSDLSYTGSSTATGKDIYTSTAGLCMNHDFPIGVPLDESFPTVYEKYTRRWRRLVALIEASRRVLVAYSLQPGGKMPSVEEMAGCLDSLRVRFPGVEFDMFVTQSSPGVVESEFTVLAPHVTLGALDYGVKDVNGGAAVKDRHDPALHNRLFAGFKVRDYRTDEERHRFEAMASKKSLSGRGCYRKGNTRILGGIRLLRFKMRKGYKGLLPLFSCETPLATLRMRRMALVVVQQKGELQEGQAPLASEANAIVKVRLALVRIAQAPVVFFSMLFRRKERFGHFLFFGYNCEIAYRFLKVNGFLDSTFFAWTNTGGGENMLNALSKFDVLFTGEMRRSAAGGDMYIDSASNVAAHTRYSPNKADRIAVQSMDDIESEKAELRSRMAHLREKFYRQLRDDEPTLAVIKLRSDECAQGDDIARRLVGRLNEMGGRNFKLLVVCQRADAVHFPSEHPDYLLRTVSRYTPDWLVATQQIGDRLGWTLIWKEFAPIRKIVQHKTYKFDKGG